MGQTFSEYLYYDQESTEIKDDIFFSEDCLITHPGEPIVYKHNLETIPEEKEIKFENINDEELDILSTDYVKKIFLLAKKELDSEVIDNKENCDILYPIRLTNSHNNMPSYYEKEYYNLKEKYNTLDYEHQILKNRYDSLKTGYNALNKNYRIIKKSNTKYKFD
jgi:hypothetical protein